VALRIWEQLEDVSQTSAWSRRSLNHQSLDNISYEAIRRLHFFLDTQATLP
jgi:hypothetical protein